MSFFKLMRMDGRSGPLLHRSAAFAKRTSLKRPTKIDFSHSMKYVIDLYPEAAAIIRVVMDSINTHKAAHCMGYFQPSKRATRKLAEYC